MKEIENQKCLHINRLNSRSTVIPADKESVYYYNKQESKNIIMLNGEYDFTYDGTPSGVLLGKESEKGNNLLWIKQYLLKYLDI